MESTKVLFEYEKKNIHEAHGDFIIATEGTSYFGSSILLLHNDSYSHASIYKRNLNFWPLLMYYIKSQAGLKVLNINHCSTKKNAYKYFEIVIKDVAGLCFPAAVVVVVVVI